MAVAHAYQSKEEVKISRRPNLSAANPNMSVPTNSPAKVAATKLASPLKPKKETDARENSPLRTSPGPM